MYLFKLEYFIIVILLCVSIPFAILPIYWVRYNKYKAIEDRGINVNGTIIGFSPVELVLSDEGSNDFSVYVIVDFYLNNICYRVKTLSVLSGYPPYEYNVGDKIDLLFLDEIPNLAIIKGEPNKWSFEHLLFLGIFLLLLLY